MSDLAGNPVAYHRTPYRLTDGDPETRWIITTVESTVNDHRGGHRPLAGPDGPPKILRIGKPVGFGQHGATASTWTSACGADRLRSQAGATLGAAVGDDGSPRAGPHPATETVLACPTTIVGLESALHGPCSQKVVKRAPQVTTCSSGRSNRGRQPTLGLTLSAAPLPGPLVGARWILLRINPTSGTPPEIRWNLAGQISPSILCP